MTKSTVCSRSLVSVNDDMPMLKVSPWIDGMIFAKSASRYSGVRPSVAATAFTRSTSKPTILPLGSLNSFGAYGMLTPTISFPDDLIASGTVFAISSTFSLAPEAALVDSLDPESLPAEQPETARAAVAANTAAMRHMFPRRISHPPSTIVSTFCLGRLTYGRLVATTALRRASAYCAAGPNFPRVACKLLSAP